MADTKLLTGIPLLDTVMEGGFKLPLDLQPRHYVAGKTNLGLQTIEAVVKSGGSYCYIDSEHALDHQYLDDLGVTLKKQEDQMTESCDVCRARAKGCDVCIYFRDVCFDTVCASFTLQPEPMCPKCKTYEVRVHTVPGLTPVVFYCKCPICGETGPRMNRFDTAVDYWRTNS